MKLLEDHGLWLATTSNHSNHSHLFGGTCKVFQPDPSIKWSGAFEDHDDHVSKAGRPSDPTGGDDKQFASEGFVTILKQAAGAYKSMTPSLTGPNNFSSTVIVTLCDQEYIAHLNNFQCFLDRIGLKFLVIYVDGEQHTPLSNQSYVQNMFVYHYQSAGSGSGTRPIHATKNFQFQVIKSVIGRGYDVIFADVDTILVRDPVPIVSFRGIDVAYAVTAKCPMYVVFTSHFFG
jgi:hypothetical protein